MPVLDLDGLTRYDGNIKNYIGRFANWQKSQKAGAVAIYPVPETVLEPIVDILFAETPPAEGDKSPSNPSTINGVSSVKVTRCGKNLLIYPYIELSHVYTAGLIASAGIDGSVTLNGMSTSSSTPYFSVSDGGPRAGENPSSMILSVGETYTASLVVSSGTVASATDVRLVIVDHDAGVVAATVSAGSSVTFTANSPHIRARLEIKKDITFSNVTVLPQLELGSDATAFEPYEGADYTVNLGGTFYGGSVDLSAGTMTVTWFGEYVSTITNVELASTYVRTTLAVTYGHMGSGTAPVYFRSNYDDDGTYVYPRYSAGTARISISFLYEMLDLDPSTATTETARTTVESFLAQHPCFVAYKLYTPYTVQLTPQQLKALPALSHYVPRQNTIYTPHESVQVGYAKSPIRSEYELTQAIIATEGGE